MAAIGGVLASQESSFVSPILMGAGVAWANLQASDLGEQPQRQLRLKLAAPFAAAVLAVACAVPLGAADVANAAIICCASVAASWLLAEGRMTPGMACVVVGLSFAAHLGTDDALMRAQGSTLQAYVDEILAAMQSQFSATASLAAQFQAVKSAIGVLWPVAYVVVAFAEYLFARFGVWLAFGRAQAQGSQKKLPKLADFDLPLWVVGVLVASALGLAVALTWPELAAPWPLMASANLLMALRFAFAVQGLGVLAWLVAKKELGPLASFLLTALALVLEVQFFVVTVAGLADVWANFRHLSRGAEGGPSDGESAQQDSQPA